MRQPSRNNDPNTLFIMADGHPKAWARMTQLLEAKMLEIGDDMLHRS